jgi:DNA-binding NtrC family response regulator
MSGFTSPAGLPVEQMRDWEKSVAGVFIDRGMSYHKARRRFTRAYVTVSLEYFLGNISRAARFSCISRNQFTRLMQALKIDARPLRKPGRNLPERRTGHARRKPQAA